MQDLFTLKEWAEYTGVSYWFWWKLSKAGKIPCIRTAGKILVRKSSIEEWMTTQETASMQTENNNSVDGIRCIN